MYRRLKLVHTHTPHREAAAILKLPISIRYAGCTRARANIANKSNKRNNESTHVYICICKKTQCYAVKNKTKFKKKHRNKFEFLYVSLSQGKTITKIYYLTEKNLLKRCKKNHLHLNANCRRWNYVPIFSFIDFFQRASSQLVVVVLLLVFWNLFKNRLTFTCAPVTAESFCSSQVEACKFKRF